MVKPRLKQVLKADQSEHGIAEATIQLHAAMAQQSSATFTVLLDQAVQSLPGDLLLRNIALFYVIAVIAIGIAITAPEPTTSGLY